MGYEGRIYQMKKQTSQPSKKGIYAAIAGSILVAWSRIWLFYKGKVMKTFDQISNKL